MSANTFEIFIRPGKAAATYEVTTATAEHVLIAQGDYATVLAALVAAYPAIPEGQWRKHLDDVYVREGVRVAVATGDRQHRNRPQYGPLKPDTNLLPS